MGEITPVSVEFVALFIRHMDEQYGPRVCGPALEKALDHLGQAEALYRTLPEVSKKGGGE